MKILRGILPFALCIFVIAFMPFAYKKTTARQTLPIKTPEHKYVLTLWHIDVFEGGVGSRGDFLSKIAVEFRSNGVLVMVVNHTVESAENSIKQGVLPDMISYGVGVDFVAKYAKSLPKNSFSGGEIGGKIYAYPWCAGAYFLITKNENNQPIDKLFISKSAYNIPFISLFLGKVDAKEIEMKKPLDAYTSFLSAKENVALLGTQRDLKRLEQRGVDFYAQPIGGFNDLIQYVSVTTCDSGRFGECIKFINYLISEKPQKQLSKIGMLSVYYGVYTDGAMAKVSFGDFYYTVSPFVSRGVLTDANRVFSTTNITNISLLDFKNVLKRL